MQTRFLKSYFHTSSEFVQKSFLHVLRAGHLQTASGYRVERRFCADHDLIYCLSGRGFVRLNGKQHTVGQSELLWIDGSIPHAHWADEQEPWTVLWIRAGGAALVHSAAELSACRKPVFCVHGNTEETFLKVLDHLHHHPLALDALLNADLSLILSDLFAQRLSVNVQSPDDEHALGELKHVIEQISAYFYKRWTVRDLARMARMSEATFYRNFQRTTGSSPLSWIRQQRMSHAKRRLVETSDSAKQIAEQVGYSDPFFFSRDFKHSCGASPKLYRQQERHEPPSRLR